MPPITPIKSKMIAPCGMNCGICMAHLRVKNHCPGCLGPDTDKSKYCLTCIMKNCDKRRGKYCFTCDSYPCKRLKQLDKRYQTRYDMSMLENLDYIKTGGIRKFVSNEKVRWACKECGGTVNVHRKVCSVCGCETNR